MKQIECLELNSQMIDTINLFFLSTIGTKVIISGGYGAATHTELLDLKTGHNAQLPDLPTAKEGVTGGMLGDMPLVIGGNENGDEVLQIDKVITPFPSHLKEKRESAATTPFKQALWVTGGYKKIKSTELIQRDGNIIAGPELPVGADCHAIVEVLPDEQYILIGGWTEDCQYSKATYFFHVNNERWTRGPDLIEGRRWHTAGIIQDSVTHDPYIVVVGGYNGEYLRSVEKMKVGSEKWDQGKQPLISICHSVEFDQFSSTRDTFAYTSWWSSNDSLGQEPRCPRWRDQPYVNNVVFFLLPLGMQEWHFNLARDQAKVDEGKK